MGLFQKVEGATAILSQNGIYRQVNVYTRDHYVYAELGTGFIKLMADGSTTKARCRLDMIVHDDPLYVDSLGRLVTSNTCRGAKALSEPQTRRLLGEAENQISSRD